jgi:hypothetical protein
VLGRLATENETALAALREQVDNFDAAAEPGAVIPLNRLVAEFGLRSFQTLHDWAHWVLEHGFLEHAVQAQGEGDVVAAAGRGEGARQR